MRRSSPDSWRRRTSSAAADEDLRERHAAAVGQERGELREEAGVHGEVPLVEGRAEPPQDGPHGAAVLVGAADDAEGGEVQHHAPGPRGELRGGAGWDRGLLERAEDPERGGGDADAVEDARRWGGGRSGDVGGGVRHEEQGLEVLEGRGVEG